VILALAAWLFWRRLDRWRRLPDRAGRIPVGAVVLLAIGAALLVWATLAGAGDLLIPSLLGTVLGLASLAKGGAGVRALALPALFALFAVPIPAPLANELIFRFQLWTAQLTGELLQLVGLSASVSGERILRADYTFSVIEACSGLRSVETLAMLAVLMVDLFRRPALHAALVVLAAPGIAFGLNALRAFALIVNPHSTLATVHTAQGVAILLTGLLVLYGLDGLLARLTVGGPPAPETAAAPAGAPSSPARARAMLAYLALLAAASLALRPWPLPEQMQLALPLRFMPRLADWSGTEHSIDRVFLGSVGLRESLAVRFRRDRVEVDVFLGVGDRSQRFRSALSPKTALPGSGWVVEERGRLELEAGAPTADSLLIRSGTRWVLVYHWYEGSEGVAWESLRTATALDASPWRKRGDPLAVAVSTELGGPGPEERQAAAERLRAFLPALQVQLEFIARDLGRKRFS
jgi:EpsI family protein